MAQGTETQMKPAGAGKPPVLLPGRPVVISPARLASPHATGGAHITPAAGTPTAPAGIPVLLSGQSVYVQAGAGGNLLGLTSGNGTPSYSITSGNGTPSYGIASCGNGTPSCGTLPPSAVTAMPQAVVVTTHTPGKGEDGAKPEKSAKKRHRPKPPTPEIAAMVMEARERLADIRDSEAVRGESPLRVLADAAERSAGSLRPLGINEFQILRTLSRQSSDAVRSALLDARNIIEVAHAIKLLQKSDLKDPKIDRVLKVLPDIQKWIDESAAKLKLDGSDVRGLFRTYIAVQLATEPLGAAGPAPFSDDARHAAASLFANSAPGKNADERRLRYQIASGLISEFVVHGRQLALKTESQALAERFKKEGGPTAKAAITRGTAEFSASDLSSILGDSIFAKLSRFYLAALKSNSGERDPFVARAQARGFYELLIHYVRAGVSPAGSEFTGSRMATRGLETEIFRNAISGIPDADIVFSDASLELMRRFFISIGGNTPSLDELRPRPAIVHANESGAKTNFIRYNPLIDGGIRELIERMEDAGVAFDADFRERFEKVTGGYSFDNFLKWGSFHSASQGGDVEIQDFPAPRYSAVSETWPEIVERAHQLGTLQDLAIQIPNPNFERALWLQMILQAGKDGALKSLVSSYIPDAFAHKKTPASQRSAAVAHAIANGNPEDAVTEPRTKVAIRAILPAFHLLRQVALEKGLALDPMDFMSAAFIKVRRIVAAQNKGVIKITVPSFMTPNVPYPMWGLETLTRLFVVHGFARETSESSMHAHMRGDVFFAEYWNLRNYLELVAASGLTGTDRANFYTFMAGFLRFKFVLDAIMPEIYDEKTGKKLGAAKSVSTRFRVELTDDGAEYAEGSYRAPDRTKAAARLAEAASGRYEELLAYTSEFAGALVFASRLLPESFSVHNREGPISIERTIAEIEELSVRQIGVRARLRDRSATASLKEKDVDDILKFCANARARAHDIILFTQARGVAKNVGGAPVEFIAMPRDEGASVRVSQSGIPVIAIDDIAHRAHLEGWDDARSGNLITVRAVVGRMIYEGKIPSESIPSRDALLELVRRNTTLSEESVKMAVGDFLDAEKNQGRRPPPDEITLVLKRRATEISHSEPFIAIPRMANKDWRVLLAEMAAERGIGESDAGHIVDGVLGYLKANRRFVYVFQPEKLEAALKKSLEKADVKAESAVVLDFFRTAAVASSTARASAQEPLPVIDRLMRASVEAVAIYLFAISPRAMPGEALAFDQGILDDVVKFVAARYGISDADEVAAIRKHASDEARIIGRAPRAPSTSRPEESLIANAGGLVSDEFDDFAADWQKKHRTTPLMKAHVFDAYFHLVRRFLAGEKIGKAEARDALAKELEAEPRKEEVEMLLGFLLDRATVCKFWCDLINDEKNGIAAHLAAGFAKPSPAGSLSHGIVDGPAAAAVAMEYAAHRLLLAIPTSVASVAQRVAAEDLEPYPRLIERAGEAYHTVLASYLAARQRAFKQELEDGTTAVELLTGDETRTFNSFDEFYSAVLLDAGFADEGKPSAARLEAAELSFSRCRRMTGRGETIEPLYDVAKRQYELRVKPRHESLASKHESEFGEFEKLLQDAARFNSDVAEISARHLVSIDAKTLNAFAAENAKKAIAADIRAFTETQLRTGEAQKAITRIGELAISLAGDDSPEGLRELDPLSWAETAEAAFAASREMLLSGGRDLAKSMSDVDARIREIESSTEISRLTERASTLAAEAALSAARLKAENGSAEQTLERARDIIDKHDKIMDEIKAGAALTVSDFRAIAVRMAENLIEAASTSEQLKTAEGKLRNATEKISPLPGTTVEELKRAISQLRSMGAAPPDSWTSALRELAMALSQTIALRDDSSQKLEKIDTLGAKAKEAIDKAEQNVPIGDDIGLGEELAAATPSENSLSTKKLGDKMAVELRATVSSLVSAHILGIGDKGAMVAVSEYQKFESWQRRGMTGPLKLKDIFGRELTADSASRPLRSTRVEGLPATSKARRLSLAASALKGTDTAEERLFAILVHLSQVGDTGALPLALGISAAIAGGDTPSGDMKQPQKISLRDLMREALKKTIRQFASDHWNELEKVMGPELEVISAAGIGKPETEHLPMMTAANAVTSREGLLNEAKALREVMRKNGGVVLRMMPSGTLGLTTREDLQRMGEGIPYTVFNHRAGVTREVRDPSLLRDFRPFGIDFDGSGSSPVKTAELRFLHRIFSDPELSDLGAIYQMSMVGSHLHAALFRKSPLLYGELPGRETPLRPRELQPMARQLFFMVQSGFAEMAELEADEFAPKTLSRLIEDLHDSPWQRESTDKIKDMLANNRVFRASMAALVAMLSYAQKTEDKPAQTRELDFDLEYLKGLHLQMTERSDNVERWIADQAVAIASRYNQMRHKMIFSTPGRGVARRVERPITELIPADEHMVKEFPETGLVGIHHVWNARNLDMSAGNPSDSVMIAMRAVRMVYPQYANMTVLINQAYPGIKSFGSDLARLEKILATDSISTDTSEEARTKPLVAWLLDTYIKNRQALLAELKKEMKPGMTRTRWLTGTDNPERGNPTDWSEFSPEVAGAARDFTNVPESYPAAAHPPMFDIPERELLPPSDILLGDIPEETIISRYEDIRRELKLEERLAPAKEGDSAYDLLENMLKYLSNFRWDTVQKNAHGRTAAALYKSILSMRLTILMELMLSTIKTSAESDSIPQTALLRANGPTSLTQAGGPTYARGEYGPTQHRRMLRLIDHLIAHPTENPVAVLSVLGGGTIIGTSSARDVAGLTKVSNVWAEDGVTQDGVIDISDVDFSPGRLLIVEPITYSQRSRRTVWLRIFRRIFEDPNLLDLGYLVRRGFCNTSLCDFVYDMLSPILLTPEGKKPPIDLEAVQRMATKVWRGSARTRDGSPVFDGIELIGFSGWIDALSGMPSYSTSKALEIPQDAPERMNRAYVASLMHITYLLLSLSKKRPDDIYLEKQVKLLEEMCKRATTPGEATESLLRLFQEKATELYRQCTPIIHPLGFGRRFLRSFLREGLPEGMARQMPEIELLGPAQILIVAEEISLADEDDDGAFLKKVLRKVEDAPWFAGVVTLLWSVRDRIDLEPLAKGVRRVIEDDDVKKTVHTVMEFYRENREAIVETLEAESRGNMSLARWFTGTEKPWEGAPHYLNLEALGRPATRAYKEVPKEDFLPERDFWRIDSMSREEIMQRFADLDAPNPAARHIPQDKRSDLNLLEAMTFHVSALLHGEFVDRNLSAYPDELAKLRAFYRFILINRSAFLVRVKEARNRQNTP